MKNERSNNIFLSEGINVLSLFDGISCGQVALERAGIKVNTYFASEIDKHAIKVTQSNHPNTKQIGDVTKVKVKLLYLSEVYSYICNYDNNLQSKISEWEILYWLDKKYAMSTKVGTQKSNEGQEVQEFTTLQCIEEIRFSNNSMGSITKGRNNTGSRKNGDENDCRKPFKLQCSSWGYDYEFHTRNLQENIRESKGSAKDRYSEKENITNIEEKISRQKGEGFNFKENQRSDADSRSEKEILGESDEDRLRREVKKKERDRKEEEINSIEEIIKELQRWDEVDKIEKNYWDFLRLHKEEQVTVVEYEGGLNVFKGRIDLLCGGSPCQGFSFSGKQLNFEDPRSKLFFEFVRLLNEVKPKYWLLENVVMKQEYQDVISQHLGVEPVKLNSSLTSAQNRVRLYWANFDITEPTDKGIGLEDILEDTEMIGPSAIRGRRLNKATILGRRLDELGKRQDYDKTIPITQCLEVRATNRDKSNCLTTVAKDTVLTTMEIGRHPDAFNRKLPFRNYNKIERCRLMNLPDNYCDEISDNQTVKATGNGWEVGMITHIFNQMAAQADKERGEEKNIITAYMHEPSLKTGT